MHYHSPLPWTAKDNGNHGELFDSNGRLVVASDDKKDGTGFQRYGFCVAENDDAAFAALAANCHDDLVAACGGAVALFEVWKNTIFARSGVTWITEPPAIVAARHAIAKAACQ